MRIFFLRFSHFVAVTAVCAFSVVWAGPALAQTLTDGIYEINGDINSPAVRAPFSGSFVVQGGAVDEVTITFANDIIGSATAGSIYSGTAISVATTTSLSGTLALTNPPPSLPDTGFLTLNGDGTFDCGGIDIGISIETCQLNKGIYGTATSEKTGNYSITLVTPAVEAPAETSQLQVTGFLQDRGNSVIAAQPNLVGHLAGTATGAFNVDATQGTGRFEIATPGGQPVWASVQGNWSESGDAKNSYFLGVAGAHYAINPDFLLGGMVEFDRFHQEIGETTVNGDGYLIGPYFVAKLPEQPLYFEGRYLIGQTDNTVSVGDAVGQDFDTDRRLASLKVAGQFAHNDLILTPSLVATHLEDTQGAFTDNDGNDIAEQGITMQDIALGLDFAKPLAMDNGELTFTGGLVGVWSKTEGTGVAENLTPSFDGGRAQVHLGTTYVIDNGVTLHVAANYDGIGTDDFESFGLEVGFEMTF